MNRWIIAVSIIPGHGVDANIQPSVVEGSCLGQADHPVLPGYICGFCLESFDPRTGRGVYDGAAASLLEHQRNFML